MPERDFDIYRRNYYWFQLNFFLRSWHKSHSDKLLSFLWDLYIDDEEVHWRWELKELGKPPVKTLKRPPRGMRKSEALQQLSIMRAAEPIKTFDGNAWLPKTASKRSIRCRYMLFDWLRGKNNKIWDNFASLYRAMIVYDMHKRGKSFFEIAQSWGAEDKSLMEMEEFRLLPVYEMEIRRALGSKKHIGSCDSFSPRFFRYTGHDRYDLNQEIRFSAIKIKHYYSHATKLIQLARNGNFETLASLIPPKH